MGCTQSDKALTDQIPDLPWDPKTAIHTTETNTYGEIDLSDRFLDYNGAEKPAKVIVSNCYLKFVLLWLGKTSQLVQVHIIV